MRPAAAISPLPIPPAMTITAKLLSSAQGGSEAGSRAPVIMNQNPKKRRTYRVIDI